MATQLSILRSIWSFRQRRTSSTLGGDFDVKSQQDTSLTLGCRIGERDGHDGNVSEILHSRQDKK